jgi:hypothetical protein
VNLTKLSQWLSLLTFDLAILDINLNGKSVLPMVEAGESPQAAVHFSDRIWFVELTGGIPTLSVAAKSFQLNELSKIIATLLNRRDT